MPSNTNTNHTPTMEQWITECKAENEAKAAAAGLSLKEWGEQQRRRGISQATEDAYLSAAKLEQHDALTARVAELESALREIGDAMESDDDYNGRAAERYRIAARAALAKEQA